MKYNNEGIIGYSKDDGFLYHYTIDDIILIAFGNNCNMKSFHNKIWWNRKREQRKKIFEILK